MNGEERPHDAEGGFIIPPGTTCHFCPSCRIVTMDYAINLVADDRGHIRKEVVPSPDCSFCGRRLEQGLVDDVFATFRNEIVLKRTGKTVEEALQLGISAVADEPTVVVRTI